MRQQGFQPLDSAVIPRFAEPATFMRTPYVQSYAGLDIALVGVPFDLGSTNRAGARHGPAQIREMSHYCWRASSSADSTWRRASSAAA
jgi:guanidinopropionase